MNRIDFVQKEIRKHKNWLLKELYTRNTDLFNIDDLLYFFPNNKLKLAGISMKRGGRLKKKRKRELLHNQLFFNTIEDIIDDVICKEWQDDQWFGRFVDFKNII